MSTSWRVKNEQLFDLMFESSPHGAQFECKTAYWNAKEYYYQRDLILDAHFADCSECRDELPRVCQAIKCFFEYWDGP